MIDETKERELNPPDIRPVQTFYDLTSDEQNEILDAEFMQSNLGDVMADMHDNELLHDVISAVHRAWQERNGLKDEDFSFVESMADIFAAWDKALHRTFQKEAEEMIQQINAERVATFENEE